MDAVDIEDLFRPFARVTVKRMFGGLGIYADGLFFALEAGGEVYLKTDALTQPRFREIGSQPFVFDSGSKPVTTSYWRLPDIAHDDEGELAAWSRLAIEAATRAKAAKAKKPGRARRKAPS